MDREFPEIERLLVSEILHAGGPAVGNDHEMPGGVGVLVENEEGVPTAADHQMGGVIGSGGGLREEVLTVAPLPAEILDPPGGPE